MLRKISLHSGSQMDASETYFNMCRLSCTTIGDACEYLSPILHVDVQECADDASDPATPLHSFHSSMKQVGTLGQLRANAPFCRSLFRDKMRLPAVVEPGGQATRTTRTQLEQCLEVSFPHDNKTYSTSRPLLITGLVSELWKVAEKGVVAFDKDREVDNCPVLRNPPVFRYIDIPFDFLSSDRFVASLSGARRPETERPVGNIVSDPGFLNVTEHAFVVGRYAVIHFKNGGLDAQKILFRTKVPLNARFPTAPSTMRAFSLVSAVIHTGRRGTEGHYTAIVNSRAFVGKAGTGTARVRDPEADIWMLLDDDHATAMAASDVSRMCFSPPGSTPMLLFYKRDDVASIAGDLSRVREGGDFDTADAVAVVDKVSRQEALLVANAGKVATRGVQVSRRLLAWLDRASASSNANATRVDDRYSRVHPRMRNVGNSCHFNAVANAWFLFAPEVMTLAPRRKAIAFLFLSTLRQTLTRGVSVDVAPGDGDASPVQRTPAASQGPAWSDADIATFAYDTVAGDEKYVLRALWIDEVAVTASMRRRKIGRMLFEKALDSGDASLRGFDQVHLLVGTGPDKEAARKLYKSLGFRPLARSCRKYHFPDSGGEPGRRLLPYAPGDGEEYLVAPRALVLKLARGEMASRPDITLTTPPSSKWLASTMTEDVRSIFAEGASASRLSYFNKLSMRRDLHVTVAHTRMRWT